MLNTFQDKIVGLSLCNGKDALYVPINHINPTYGTKLQNQIPEDSLKELFKNLKNNKHYKWVYHNSKFDLAVFSTFLGFDMPDPYWDTLIAAYIINQDEDHSLKALYNKYIAEEDEGVNRFDTLFKGVTFDYIPFSIATIYAGKDALMTYKLYMYQKEYLEQKDNKKMLDVLTQIEIPLIPILADMYQYGVNINEQMLAQLYKKYDDRLKTAECEVYKEINKYKNEIEAYKVKNYNHKLDNPINLGSPSQLSTLFYKILGYKTKSGKGTGVEDLEEINSDLTKALLEYRKMQKLIDAFLVALNWLRSLLVIMG